MPFATRFRLFRFRLLALLVLLASAASSCQSSRASFSFQSISLSSPVRVAEKPVKLVDSMAAVSVPVRAGHPVAATLPAPRPQPVGRVSKTSAAAVVPAETTPAKLASAPARHRRAWLARPRAATEAGLGTTVLGVLGLIMLPVAALGLILSGGALGWIIVGGLAALAVLVAWLDPFGE
ncbi:hypothetical protein [Hymenobacter ruricola]|uniref:Uncharacterized protein n=1 Tax=Hymenobacter ruricola TaxID=2791023 RepID=A0ABS0IA72_9BACT|nr:hypothetical protein [Hymenobacter ruricola]MBF9223807.1 hypothetical protein [Hymenobacter ruricola]